MQCRDFGIPLEGWHTETGVSLLVVGMAQLSLSRVTVQPGVYEAALAYTDSLRMADNAILFKMTCKACKYQLTTSSRHLQEMCSQKLFSRSSHLASLANAIR